MLFNIKGFITSKKGELYSDCRDNYQLNKENHKVAISDGVSKSFFPGIWSELLVTNYVDFKGIGIDELIEKSQKEWLAQVNEIVSKPDVKWFTKNAYNRKTAGLATFVGLQFFEEEKSWKATALGDSFLFFMPDEHEGFEKSCFKLSSKPEPILFDNFPDYFSSYGNGHNGETNHVKSELYAGTFYLMTDALSEWFLNEKEDAVEEIAKWEDQAQYEKFIEQARENGKLTNDDSAILVIKVIEDAKPDFNYNIQVMSKLRDLIKDQDREREEKAIALQSQIKAAPDPIQKEEEKEPIQEEGETTPQGESNGQYSGTPKVELQELSIGESVINESDNNMQKSKLEENTSLQVGKKTEENIPTKGSDSWMSRWEFIPNLFKDKVGTKKKGLKNITEKF